MLAIKLRRDVVLISSKHVLCVADQRLHCRVCLVADLRPMSVVDLGA